MSRRFRVALALVLLLLASGQRRTVAIQAEPPAYRIVDLGTLGGWSEAWALNNRGQVAGASLGPDGIIQPFLWQGGVLSPLVLPRPGLHTLAKGINDAGQVTGYSHDAQTPARSYIWQGAEVFDLGLLPAGQSANAADINGNGAVALTADGQAAVFEGRVLTALDEGGCCGSAMAINDAGLVAGQAPGFGPPALWRSGVRQDLPALGGTTGRAEALNEAGVVVGTAATPAGDSRAFRWDGAMLELGTLGGPNSAAFDINELGVIVGASDTGAGPRNRQAFIWQDGALRDLNELLPPDSGWTLTVARAINDHGQIAGTGIVHGAERAFLMTPLPREDAPDLHLSIRYQGITGDEATFLLIAGNRSRSLAASAVVLTAELPAGLAVRRATPSGAGGCAVTSPVICAFPAIAPAADVTVALVVGVLSPGRHAVYARVASAAPDAHPADNTAHLTADLHPNWRPATAAPPPTSTACPTRTGCPPRN